MIYVMTLGGRTGPESRVELCDTIKAFYTIYGVEPKQMTIMPDNMKTLKDMIGSSTEADNMSAMLLRRASVQILGLEVKLGHAYTLSA